ncbi:PadR family transcriptional regulator [Cellulomonas edaphi]|uniref:PadR family transcriptional regulator n=1 Tax=Cellulomonas edaphi TaxID=3053468 RepID=A0ABT7S481_9CELL|nr:PadR family transcriptional regulator [Cellulomons edaphi]MDM7830420.1 PadR family transcriptional regulator [Cellulomons edaphi]
MTYDHIPRHPGDHRERGPRRPDVTDPLTGRLAGRRWRPEGFGPQGFGSQGHGPRGHGHGFGGPHGQPDEARGRGPGRGPGRRAGRGDIRAAVLLLLSEQPMHGYQLIQEIGQRSGGRWRPSPGAIYPALALLEDEGLVGITADAGRKLASLTDAGTAYVAENAAELGSPFDDAQSRPGHPGRPLRDALEALGAAAGQVGRTGTDEQAAAALAVLDRARRDLYLILAGEPPTA